jgi:shikimate kinase
LTEFLNLYSVSVLFSPVVLAVEDNVKFIILFGPPAVGKMTVGYELAKLTDFRLFHNHMTIDLVLNFFEFGHARFNTLVSEFRRRVFEEVAASDLPGLIFTFVWALDHESDKAFIERSCNIFRDKGARVYFVELEADISERLKRNESEFRLSQKPSKRDVEKSRERLLDDDRKYKLNSNDDFFYKENYLKINNVNLSAHETARIIVDKFEFPIVNATPGS